MTTVVDMKSISNGAENANKATPAVPINLAGGNGKTDGDDMKLSKNESHTELQRVQDLDDAVTRVRALWGDASGNLYQAMKEVKQIKENSLWKLRTDAKGKARYGSFEQFCKEELNLTSRHVKTQLAVVENFREVDVQKYNMTHLHLLLGAPSEARETLMKSHLDKGATSRQLRQEVKKLAAQAPVDPTKAKSRTEKATARASAKAAEARGRKTITIANIKSPDSVEFRVPAGKRASTEEEWNALESVKVSKEVQKLIDQKITARKVLDNGVVLYIQLQASPSGNLRTKITTIRED
jgi:hypothetical protein